MTMSRGPKPLLQLNIFMAILIIMQLGQMIYYVTRSVVGACVLTGGPSMPRFPLSPLGPDGPVGPGGPAKHGKIDIRIHCLLITFISVHQHNHYFCNCHC